MESTLVFFLSQLLSQGPMLLAYLVGAILALVFWRRCPSPARLTLIATLLLLVVSLVQSFLVSFFVQARVDQGWSYEQVGLIMAVLGLVASLIRVTAFALLLTAVFMGRKVTPAAMFHQALPVTEPLASQGSIEHGITRLPGS
jgi:hypothetical protein